MTPKARRRREIVYWIEQGIVCAITMAGFCGVLIIYRTIFQILGCD